MCPPAGCSLVYSWSNWLWFFVSGRNQFECVPSPAIFISLHNAHGIHNMQMHERSSRRCRVTSPDWSLRCMRQIGADKFLHRGGQMRPGFVCAGFASQIYTRFCVCRLCWHKIGAAAAAAVASVHLEGLSFVCLCVFYTYYIPLNRRRANTCGVN